MKKEIILTPEELYYMGALLQAKYIDYAYVAAMGDIQQKREIYESESRKKLAEKGILMEDFSGGLEVEESAKRLLDPVFLGELESSVDVVSLTEDGKKIQQNKRFHYHEGRITSTVIEEDGIYITGADDGQLQAWIGGLLGLDYDAKQETIPARTIDRKQISRIIAVKSTKVGQRAAVEIYIEYEGRIYREIEGGQAQSLTREQFNLEIYRGVKGE